MNESTRKEDGFTFVELVMIVSILAILLAIMVPKLGTAIRTANEGATKGKLGSIRTALSIYFADTEGVYPTDLTPLMQPGSRYLTQVVPLYTASHGSSNGVTYVSNPDDSDTGGWGYVNSGSNFGTIWVQCTHTDLKGKQWSQY